MSGFDRLVTTACSTKRAVIASGLRGTPTTNLSGLYCTPLDPLSDGNLLEREGLETPLELLQCFISGTPDIVEGDVLVVGSAEYAIRAVADWAAGVSAPAYKQLTLEELKR